MTNNKKIVWLLTMLVTVAIPPTWAQMVAASSSTGSTLADARPYWVGLSVPDAEASASWYREKLHFTVKKRLVFPDHQLKIVFLELNGYTIELVVPHTCFGKYRIAAQTLLMSSPTADRGDTMVRCENFALRAGPPL